MVLLFIVSINCANALDDTNQTLMSNNDIGDSTTLNVANNEVIKESSQNESVLTADGDGSFTDLQNDINNAISTTGVFNMQKNYIYDKDNDVAYLAGVVIGSSLIINGNGKFISGCPQISINSANEVTDSDGARIFVVQADNVAIYNVNFINGTRRYNGATTALFENAGIFWSGNNGIVEGCTFTNMLQPYRADNGGVITAADGICIYHKNTAKVDNFTINNCNFSNAAYSTWARAIYIDNVRNVTINNSDINHFAGYLSITNGEYVNITKINARNFINYNANLGTEIVMTVTATKSLYLVDNVLPFKVGSSYYGRGRITLTTGDLYMLRNSVGVINRGGNTFYATISGNAYVAYNNLTGTCYRYGSNLYVFDGVNKNNGNEITFVHNRMDSLTMSDTDSINPYNNRASVLLYRWNDATANELYFNAIYRGVAITFNNVNNVDFHHANLTNVQSAAFNFNTVVKGVAHNISLQNSNMRPISTTTGCEFFQFYESNVVIENCTFNNLKSNIAAEYSIDYLIAYLRGSNVTITRNIFNSFLPVRAITYINSLYFIDANSELNFTNNDVDDYFSSAATDIGFFRNEGVLLIEGNDFNNVRASGTAGLLYNSGDAIVRNNNFTKVYANDSGVIYNEGKLLVDSNNFTNCYSTGNNGVIYTSGDNVNITHNKLVNCYADGNFGGFNVMGNNVVIEYNTFDTFHADNYAIIYCGATDCLCYNNTYVDAYANNYAVMTLANSITLINETFINSHITDTNIGIAGVLYITGDYCNLTNINIINCSAATDGGAIYNVGTNTTINNMNITNTTAINGYGGAIYNVAPNMKINKMNINNSTSVFNGGAIYSMGNSFTLNDSSIILSHSKNDGGAIYLLGDDCIITSTNITNSSADHYGGAIYCSSNNANLTNINFTNSSAVMGGTIYIASNNVTLNHINIDNSTSEINGGAIFWAGNTGRVLYSSFNNIQALGEGGAIFFTGYNFNLTKISFNNITAMGAGGALYGSGSSDSILSDLEFDMITSGANGGAIYWSGENCLLNNLNLTTISCGANGGAIYWSAERSRINKTRFENISCNGSGGAIYSTVADCNFTHSTFINCSAIVNGGAFFLTGGNNTLLVNNTFENCSCGSNGGAIFWKASYGNLYSSNFTRNSAGGEGGAIYWNSDYSNLYDLIITNCTSGFNGGAILVSASNIDMHGLYCEGNNATDGSGGAIYSTASSSKLYSSEFINNDADAGSGGAVYWSNINGLLYNLTCTNNTAIDGGAVYLAESHATFYNSTLTNNNATNDGGALYMAGYTGGLCYNVTFNNNSADHSGGSVYWSGNDGHLYDSTFDGSFSVDGGAIYWTGSYGDLSALDFNSSNASRNGGVLFVSGSNVNVTKINFENSTAVDGGAVYWLGHYGHVSDSNFTGNDAENGGALYLLGSNFQVSNSLFYNNTASNQGGAIYWGGSGNIHDSEFRDNRAHMGSAIYNGGAVDIINTVILDNCADISAITIDWAEDSALNHLNTTFVVYGYDNFLNGIWTVSNNIGVNHVTYANGTTPVTTPNVLIRPVAGTTPDELYYDSRLAYTNVTVRIKDNRYNEYSANVTTDLYGVAHYHIVKTDNTRYNITVTKVQDSYYSQFSNSTMGYSGAFIPSIRLDLSSYDFDYHSPVFITVRITANKPGHEALYIDGTFKVYADDVYLFDLNFTEGMVSVPEILELNSGYHNMTVYYDGSVFYDPVTSEDVIITSGYSNTVYFNINKIILPLEISSNSSKVYVGEPVNIMISSSDIYKGYIRYIVANSEEYVEYYDGFNFTRIFNESGQVNVLAYAEGDDNYLPAFDYYSFEVVKKDVKMEFVNITGIFLDSINVGDAAVITVKLSENDTTGNVIINIDNKDYVAVINNGYATATIYDLDSNNLLSYSHVVVASYDGDYKYNAPSMISAILPISKIDVNDINVTCNPSTIYVGENVQINITMVPDKYEINGFVTVTINNKNYNVSIVNNAGSFNVSDLSDGNYVVQINYAGDLQFNSKIISNASSIIVNKVPVSNMSIVPEESDIFVGDDAVYNIDVVSGVAGYIVNGFVTVTVDGKQYNVSIIDGKGSLIVHGLANGTYLANVSYAGDNIFVGYDVIDKASVTVNKISVNSISIVPENSTIFVGGDAVYNIVINPTLNGFVTVTVDGKQYNVSISNGKGSLTVSGLANGTYLANVSYAGDAMFTAFDVVNTAQVKVNKVAINGIDINTFTPSIFVGQDAVYRINLSATNGYVVNGFVTVTVGGKQYNVSISNGTGSLTVSGLANGTYLADVAYAGSDVYNSASVSGKAKVEVNMVNIKTINVTAVNSSIYVGDDVVYKINVIADADGYVVNGYVTVTVGGKQYNVSISNGTGSLTVSGLDAGSYTVDVVYAGNNIYNPSSVSNKAEVVISKVNVDIGVFAGSNNIFVGEDAFYTIKLTPNVDGYNINGFVTVSANGKQYNVSIINGIGHLSVSGLLKGNYTINVTYAGSNVYNPSSVSNVANVEVNEVTISGITVTPVKSSIYVGEDAVFNVNVMSSKYLVDGFVTIYVDDSQYNVSIVGGVGSLTVPGLSAGNHPVYVSYAGDDTFDNYTKTRVSSVNVNKLDIFNINVTPVKSAIFVGEDAKYNINVSTMDGYSVNGVVIITVDNKEYNVSIVNGLGSLTVHGLSEGIYRADASYIANDMFNSMDVKKIAPVTVNKVPINFIDVNVASPIFVGEDAVFAINVVSNNTGYSVNGSVTVTINNKDYIVVINNGKGSLNVSGLASGNYNVDVVYAGDDIFNAFTNSSAVNVLVNKVPVNGISILPVKSSIFVGEDAVYNINVTTINGYVVNGFVTVTVDGKQYNVSIINGKGSLTVSGLANGTYLANVSYAGDDTFVNYSVVNKASVTVNKVPVNSISIVPVNSSIVVGQDAVYNIVVNPALNGYVTVTINNKQYNVSISNGKGSLTVSGLANGTYLANVSYAGDDTFVNYGVVNKASVTVNKVPVNSISIVPVESTISVGQNAVYNIEVFSGVAGYIVDGFVTVTVNNKQYNVSIINGKGSLTVSGLNKGTYLADVIYKGNEVYNNASVSNVAEVKVNKITIDNVVMSPENSVISVGEDVIYAINITSTDNSYLVNGFVTVTISDKQYNVSIVDGKGSLTVSGLNNGTYNVNLIYAGSDTFDSFTKDNIARITVNKVNTSIVITPVYDNIFVGEDAVYNIRVIAKEGYVVNGFVTVTVDGKQYNVSISNGKGSLTVSGLNDGTYLANVSYSGDYQFNSSHVNDAALVVVNKVDVLSIVVSPESSSIFVGQDVICDVNVINSKYLVDGFVTVTVGDVDYNVSITNGKGSFILTGLSEGNYPIYVSYAGDTTFNNYTKTRVSSINVNKVAIDNISVTPNNSNIFVGRTANLTINVTAKENYSFNGFVTIKVDNKEYNVSIADNIGHLIISGLYSGIYPVDVSYTGSDVFSSVDFNKAAYITVNKVNINSIKITPKVSNIPVGESVALTINVTADESDYLVNGFATIKLDNNDYLVSIIDGIGHLQTPNLKEGIYNIDAIYNGDNVFNSFINNNAANISVNKINTQIIFTSNQKISVGEDAIYSITVKSDNNNYIVNGSVTVTVNGVNYTVPIINGNGSLTVSGLTKGTYLANVTYAGDDLFMNSNVTNGAKVEVTKVNIERIIVNTKENPIYVGQNAVLEIKLESEKYVVNGFVTVTVANKQYNVSISNGTGSLTVSGLANGTYLVNVSYAGSDIYNPASNTNVNIIVNKVDTSISITGNNSILVGEDVIYNIAVNTNVENYAVDGYVTVTVDGKQYNVSISNGTGSLTVSGLANGTYFVNVSYVGNDIYKSSHVSNKAKVEVYKVNIADITITPNKESIFVGDDVIYTVTVTSTEENYIVNGYVTVTVDGKQYNVSISNGTGSLTVSGLANGTYFVNVSYDGSDIYNKFSDDGLARVLVNKIPTSISMTPVIINAGDVAIITAIINNADVTGNVSFIVNNVEYVTGIINGVATISVDKLNSSANKTITAIYSGNYKFINSSTTTNLTVNKIAGSATISVHNIVAGDTEHVVINISDVSNATIIILVNDEIVDDYIISNNVITFNKNIQVSGNYTVKINVKDDVKYNDFNANASFTVSKVLNDDYIINVDINNTGVFEDIPVIVRLPDDANGIMSISVDGELINDTIIVENGIAKYTLGNLSSGNHTITIDYGDDVKYGDKTVNANINIAKINSAIIIEPIDAKVGNTIINILPVGSTGDINVTINGKEFSVENRSIVNASELGVGNYTILVSLNGDDNYLESYNVSDFTISLNEISLELGEVTGEIFVDSKVTLHVDLSNNITGDIIFNINGMNYTVNVVDSDFAEYTYTPKESGIVNATAYYIDGSIYYGNVSNNITFNVNKNPISVTDLNVSDINVGDNEIITVTLNASDVTGTATIIINDTVYNVNVTGGIGVLSIPNLGNGTYNVSVYYPGNFKYLDCNLSDIEFTVSKCDAPLNIIVNDIMILDDENIIIRLPGDATGYISLIIDDGDVIYLPIINGEVSHIISGLDNGVHNVSVDYIGDYKYLANSSSNNFTVSMYVPDIEIVANDTIWSTDALNISVYLPEDATGDLIVTIDGVNYTSPIDHGVVKLAISNLTGGNYSAVVNYSGDYKYDSVSEIFNFTVNPDYVIFDVDDLVKYYGGNERLIARLSTARGEILANQTIYAYINGVNYTRVTDSNGTVSFPINLYSGVYDVIITYNNESSRYGSVDHVVTVTVLSTIAGDDLVKYFGNTTPYWAHFTDSEGNDLPDIKVEFNINGVFYTRITNESGWAKLNINLPNGNYIITVYNPVTDEKHSNNITVLSTIYAEDLVKVYCNDSQYLAYFTDSEGNALANAKVTFNINGVFYTRFTNASGWAKLNINLCAGEYIITAYNNVTGDVYSNKITVLPKIVENYDLTKKFGDPTPFTVRIVGDDGNYVGSGEEVEFNINGVMYHRYTNETGHVKLNIGLPSGVYIITTLYEDCMVSNTIKIE